MRSVVSLAVFALTTFLPATASAQRQPVADPGDPNRWGVALSFVPKWEISGGESALAKLGEVMLTRGDEGLSVQGGDGVAEVIELARALGRLPARVVLTFAIFPCRPSVFSGPIELRA